MTYKCYKTNRTSLFMNFSYTSKVDIISNKDAQLSIDTGFFRSNEYRSGPVKFNIPLCEVLTHKDFDIPYMLNHSNLHPCPIKKGESFFGYHLRPGAPNFPPLLPEGRWKLILRAVWKGTVAYVVNWYFKIVYPLPIA
ncbi:hypothetical protein PPYR_09062 [Photinus pyralis]|uniref:MD-2-related lipid-recognition domain-containing protein n=2 Tax=Photinus pyralis TaxID=7054 RepID=A0A5N4AL74_PHOPY|nr:hypothetical protein PPYR_09062 [Photinus pyralis]